MHTIGHTLESCVCIVGVNVGERISRSLFWYLCGSPVGHKEILLWAYTKASHDMFGEEIRQKEAGFVRETT